MIEDSKLGSEISQYKITREPDKENVPFCTRKMN
jgi:hypothetical protein